MFAAVSALPKVITPPPVIVILFIWLSETPFVVRVALVAFKSLKIDPATPVTDRFVAGRVTDPYGAKTDVALENASVIVPSSAPPAPPVEKSRHTAGAAEVPVTVTVNGFVPVLEPASKMTSSADVGGPNPLDPPLALDQLAVLVAFQLPDPPTQ